MRVVSTHWRKSVKSGLLTIPKMGEIPQQEQDIHVLWWRTTLILLSQGMMWTIFRFKCHTFKQIQELLTKNLGTTPVHADNSTCYLECIMLLCCLHFMLYQNWWLGSFQGRYFGVDSQKDYVVVFQFSIFSRVSTKPNYENYPNPKNAWLDEKDIKYTEVEQLLLLQVDIQLLN